jgi:type IV fimbrial biogenesis protein FimT
MQGASLIEVAAVMTIVAILVALGMPDFSQWLRNTQIRGAMEGIESGLQVARAEAIRRNRSVVFELSGVPTAGWSVGCLNVRDGGEVGVDDVIGDCPAVIRARPADEFDSEQARVNVTPNLSRRVTFDSLGRIVANADSTPSITRLDIGAGLGSRQLAVVIGAGGGFRSCDPSTAAPDTRAC